MQSILKNAAAIVLMLGAPSQLIAEDIIFEKFENQPETRWRFFADTVMGGVSIGQVKFKTEGGESYAHMTGSVSTANNGGFIQIRMAIPTSLPAGTQYPSWSMSVFSPFSVFVDQRVCQNNEFSHDHR